jgi:hypothetical protein
VRTLLLYFRSALDMFASAFAGLRRTEHVSAEKCYKPLLLFIIIELEGLYKQIYIQYFPRKRFKRTSGLPIWFAPNRNAGGPLIPREAGRAVLLLINTARCRLRKAG